MGTLLVMRISWIKNVWFIPWEPQNSGNTKGYPLKSIISGGTLTNNETAIQFEENITVPATKFTIPSGVKITEGVNPLMVVLKVC